MLLHGLGATKASFLPTVAALADRFRVIAIDLPGFGDSAKPLGAAYDARVLRPRRRPRARRARTSTARTCVGNTMGGRVALEVGFAYPERVGRLALLAPSLAWLRDRRGRRCCALVRPELGPAAARAARASSSGSSARVVPGAQRRLERASASTSSCARTSTPRGRAAFYAAARNIYLEEPDGERLLDAAAGARRRESLFVWGRQDPLVPIGFARHVREALPAAEHLELDCGHVPQLEAPRQTHAAVPGSSRAASAAVARHVRRADRFARVPSVRTIRAATFVRPRADRLRRPSP